MSDSSVDKLIATYSAELDQVYRERTAGDHTFSGVLSSLLRDFVATT